MFSERAITDAENRPGTQLTQAVAADVVEYLPTVQDAQVLFVVAPLAAEYVPMPHNLQEDKPLLSEYFPSVQ